MLDLKKVFGSSNDRKVRQMLGRVSKINALEAKYAALDDEGAARQDRGIQANASPTARRSTSS